MHGSQVPFFFIDLCPRPIAEISGAKLQARHHLPPNSLVGHLYAAPSSGGLKLKSFVDELKENIGAMNFLKALLNKGSKVAATAHASYKRAATDLCAELIGCEAEIAFTEQITARGFADPAVWMNILVRTLQVRISWPSSLLRESMTLANTRNS